MELALEFRYCREAARDVGMTSGASLTLTIFAVGTSTRSKVRGAWQDLSGKRVQLAALHHVLRSVSLQKYSRC